MILILQHFLFNIKSLERAKCTQFTPEYDPFRHVSISQCTRSAHEKMATYTKLSSGSWRVQVRRKGRYVSETFLRRDDARRWATKPSAKSIAVRHRQSLEQRA